MIDGARLNELAGQIRKIYLSDPRRAEDLIGDHLRSELSAYAEDEKLAVLDEFRKMFGNGEEVQSPGGQDMQTLSRLYSLILGEQVSPQGLTQADLIRRLADSLNTVFDSLNELLRVIHSTLGADAGSLQTIRFLIRSDLKGPESTDSLESHLGRIKEAFLTSNQAGKMAARNLVSKIAEALNPDLIVSEAGKGMGFGFLRKGEHFELYRDKFNQFMKWVESDRFIEEYSREFERQCQKLYASEGGKHEIS
jgi:hypothetical protein